VNLHTVVWESRVNRKSWRRSAAKTLRVDSSAPITHMDGNQASHIQAFKIYAFG